MRNASNNNLRSNENNNVVSSQKKGEGQEGLVDCITST